MTALDAKTALFIALAVITLFYVVVLAIGVRRERLSGTEPTAPTPGGTATGFVANFFDTLGIGSFATTTAIFRQWKMVRDERIPGTLNVGNTLPTIAQAFIYTQLVPVDARTLILMISSAVLGAWLGAGVVSRWPRSRVQLGMGLALLGAAALMLAAQLKLVPAGGDLLQLTGMRLAVGLAGNFLLGALMTIGIGLYGPCMILVSLLGMNPTAAFPIMMGSCAFLMPVASARFIRERAFDARAVVGMLIGGVPAVLIAAFIVKSLPLSAVRWLVVVVVTYTAVTLLAAARRERIAALALDAQPRSATI
ncbi:MAG: TSUP family transporter [Gemmatimonadaceae bacterium]